MYHSYRYIANHISEVIAWLETWHLSAILTKKDSQ